MTTNPIDKSQRTAAKVAGFACLIGMAIVVYSNYGIYEHLAVPGNVAETARNIVAHETLFRLSLVCNVTYTTSVVVLLAALYLILKPVNAALAFVAPFFLLLFTPICLLTP